MAFDHEDLKDKLLKSMGGRVPMEARESWGRFLIEKATRYRLRYEWIKDNRFFLWAYECPDVDFGESAESMVIWICRFGRVGH